MFRTFAWFSGITAFALDASAADVTSYLERRGSIAARANLPNAGTEQDQKSAREELERLLRVALGNPKFPGTDAGHLNTSLFGGAFGPGCRDSLYYSCSSSEGCFHAQVSDRRIPNGPRDQSLDDALRSLECEISAATDLVEFPVDKGPFEAVSVALRIWLKDCKDRVDTTMALIARKGDLLVAATRNALDESKFGKCLSSPNGDACGEVDVACIKQMVREDKEVAERLAKKAVELARFAGNLDVGAPTSAPASAPLYSGDPELPEPNGEPVPLAGGGKVVPLKNVQKIGDDCIATREWVEIQGIDPKAQEKINGYVRKNLTVGMRLRESNCTGPSTFFNMANLTGKRRRAIGVLTSVRVGRASSGGGCSVFTLADGKRHDLGDALTPAGKKFVVDTYCAKLRTRNVNSERFCGDYAQLLKSLVIPQIEYCLMDEGVMARIRASEIAEELAIPEGKVQEAFRLPFALE